MRLRTAVIVGVVIALALPAFIASPATAQTLTTGWGDPDLGGLWDFRTITPFQRPEELGDQEFLTEEEAANLEQGIVARNEELANRPAERTAAANQVDRRADGTPGFYNNFWLDQGTRAVGTRRTSLLVDPPNGRMPEMTPEAEERAAAAAAYRDAHPADSWVDRTASDRCLLGFNAGPPLSPGGYNQNLHIFQTPDHVVMVTEMVHTARVVPLDGRPALGEGMAQWSGDARGRWEGDTLVVETSNFDLDRGWRNTTSSLTLVERFTRVDADTLEYRYTVNDPNTWVSPWTASIPLQRTDVPMFEYACHEGNHSMDGILAGHRAEERAAAGQN
jgi:hypothetical protein